MDKHTYKSRGLRLTPQRLAVMEYLAGNKDHPSAEEIYEEIKKKYPTMSFATVYNTLEKLKELDEVRELTIDPGRKRYDPDMERHHHLICTACKKIVDVHAEYGLSIPDEQKRGFEITGSHIEFYGICEECKKLKGGD